MDITGKTDKDQNRKDFMCQAKDSEALDNSEPWGIRAGEHHQGRNVHEDNLGGRIQPADRLSH